MPKGAIKAFIKNESTGKVKKFLYNPSEFSDTIEIKFSELGSVGGSYVNYQYVRGDNRQLTLDLWMRDSNTSVIKDFKAFIEDFIPSRTSRFKAPPLMTFCFGTYIKTFIVEGIARDWKDFNPNLEVTELSIKLSCREVIR